MDFFNEDRTKKKSSRHSTRIIITIFLLLSIILLIRLQASPINSIASLTNASRPFFKTSSDQDVSNKINILASKLRDSVTFLPIKDLRFAKTAMEGNTWFMSSLNDTREENESEHIYFPSEASKGRLLCIKGRNERDGTKNSYALAWPEALPDSALLMKGLTFVSDTYYDYVNLWHGVCAMAPFVGWSIKNECMKPERWVLYHWGEMRFKMGSWLQHVMEATFGEVNVEKFESADEPYCFEKAVVMRHNQGSMGKERKLQVFDLLRCKARRFCGIDPSGTGNKVNERGEPVIRLTLLMRRGSRSFKNATTVTDIFAKECAKVEGCVLKVAQSEDLSFCDQVRTSPH